MAVDMKRFLKERENPEVLTEPPELIMPIVILLDTSESMSAHLPDLRETLDALAEVLELDRMIASHGEMSIIAFGDGAWIAQPFRCIYDSQMPPLTFGGRGNLFNGIGLGLNVLDRRKRQYREYHVPWRCPRIFLLTDGRDPGRDNGTLERLRQEMENRRCNFFPVAVGKDADLAFLKTLRPDGGVIQGRDEILEAFRWLVRDYYGLARNEPEQKVICPDLGDCLKIEI